MPHFTVKPARPEQWTAAVQWLFADDEATEEAPSAARAARFLTSGELDPRGLLLALHGEELLGAMLCTMAPGAVGLVWPPRAAEHPRSSDIEDQLIRAALVWFEHEGVKLAQALLPPGAASPPRKWGEQRAESLLRHGFRRVTALYYLRHDLDHPLPPRAGDLHFQALQAVDSDVFATIIASTYEQSLDCPELDGVRTMAEVLAGHRAQGVFLPQQWWLAACDRAPAGVLLLNALEDEPGWEVVYMGVVPANRGRGIGRQLALHALHEAKEAGMRFVDLCVDRRNVFARHVYRELGFELLRERVVLLTTVPPAHFADRLDDSRTS